MPLLTIASLTLREAARRRLVAAAALLALAIIAFSGWGFWKVSTSTFHGARMDPTELAATYSILVLLIAYMFSVVMGVGAAFLAAPAIAADVDSGLVLSILPRPLRRYDFVLGKWLGLALMVVLATVVIGAVELLVVRAITGYLPPHPGRAIAYLTAESVVLLTLALFFSTRMAPITSGVVAVVLFGVAWVSGVAQSLALLFHNDALLHGTTVVGLLLPTDALWRSAAYNLEPVVLALAATTDVTRQSPFLVGSPPPLATVAWAAGWVVVVLVAAVVSFNRRDL